MIRGNVGVLSTSQFISIFICLAGIVMVVYQGRKAKAQESVVSSEEE